MMTLGNNVAPVTVQALSGGNPIQSSATMRFHVCAWPDFYEVIDPCDRELYDWMIQLASPPPHIQQKIWGIQNEVYQKQYERWASCEASRYAGASEPPSGMRIKVSSRLAGGSAPGVVSHGMKARLSVPFSTPQPAQPCPSIPFHLLHRVSQMGINKYMNNTTVEFEGQTPALNGQGPWADSKVINMLSNQFYLSDISIHFKDGARIRSDRVFDHWAAFSPISNPAPPPSLMARCEPFDASKLQIMAPIPWHPLAPEGERGLSWKVAADITHDASDFAWWREWWVETPYGWTSSGPGGYGCNIPILYGVNFPPYSTEEPVSGDPEGVWTHRFVVLDFKRVPSPVIVLYDGDTVEQATSSIIPIAGTSYVPGVTQGWAVCQESVMIRTIGASKASFRILGVAPVPGFGILLTFKVVNELHFPACIVTLLFNGVWDIDYSVPNIYVVRNLAANSESAPISLFLPVEFSNEGNIAVPLSKWQSCGYSYAAQFNHFQDGIYLSGNPHNVQSINDHALKPISGINDPASLAAGYLENGTKVWNSINGGLDPAMTIITLPLAKAPGAPVPSLIDPELGASDFIFTLWVEWTAEYRVSFSPEIWETRTGKERIRLTTSDAIARYGNRLTLNVADGRPMQAPYAWGRYKTVFESWPGGNIAELEAHMVDTFLQPQFQSPYWRNLSYNVLKPPYLVVTNNPWVETSAAPPSYLYPTTYVIAKETTSTSSVEVLIA